jgi:hypothetical protein
MSVNKGTLAGKNLEHALQRQLTEILADVPWLRPKTLPVADRGQDMVVRLEPRGGSHADLEVHVKAEVRPGIFRSWAGQHRTTASRRSVPVLATPFVSPRLADLCKDAGWGWYDLAGNCHLDVPQLLHIERRGNPPVHRRPRDAANLSTAAATRVMRALLSPAHAGRTWTQRGLRMFTCCKGLTGDQPVSLGLVNKVIRHLRNEGFLEERGHGVRVRDAMGLLEAWREAYRFDRHERRSYFTLMKGAELEKALHMADLHAGGFVAAAAFSAAERQAPRVRQPKTWLYVGAAFVDLTAEHLNAKEVDSGENLVILVPDDAGVFMSFETDAYIGEQRIRCTDPVQTYVDLFHAGGRGDDAAEAVLAQRIRPAWDKALPS